MHRNKSVNVHSFAMVPRADIPRSSFQMQKTLKTTGNGGRLYPMFCEEVLPGDTFSLRATAFARLATPLFPIMDNMRFDTFYFFCPNRLVWENWERFMGSQDDPGDSIDFEIPQMVSPVNGWQQGSVGDHFGLPTVGQVAGGETVSSSALPFRMYDLIYNQWFRDQNLLDSRVMSLDDGPDDPTGYAVPLVRAKKHDYFTGALPSPQRGTVPVPLPLAGTATVMTSASTLVTGVQPALTIHRTATGGPPAAGSILLGAINTTGHMSESNATGMGITGNELYPANLFADLSTATATTINQLREAFQIQRLLERDARGGTRYTEVVRSHFGVISPDARLQRPEYLGGSSTPVAINPVAQTSATSADGTDTPQGNLSAIGTSLNQSGFSQSFTEHGYIIGLWMCRGDLTYQQGLRRHWSRLTRYDFYFPVFAHLGEQAILSKEIYCTGVTADDNLVFGYQERWAEYRYLQNEITGMFRSTDANTIDPWHLAEQFSVRPVLDESFILDPSEVTFSRIIAVGSGAGGQQLLLDMFFDVKAARPMPMYSVPGMIDHF